MSTDVQSRSTPAHRAIDCAVTVDPARMHVAEWRRLNSIHGHVESAASSALTEIGLSLVEFTVLDILQEQVDGHMRMQDVARVAGLTTGATTRLANRLEARGLLRRVLCSWDRRGIYTELTGEGADLLNRARVDHDRAVHKVLSDVGVVGTLLDLADALRQH